MLPTGDQKKSKSQGRHKDNYKKINEASENHQEIRDTIRKRDNFAEVSYSLGTTLNMGQYESIRIHVGLTLPCPPDKVDQAFKIAIKKVTQILKEQVSEKTGREL